MGENGQRHPAPLRYPKRIRFGPEPVAYESEQRLGVLTDFKGSGYPSMQLFEIGIPFALVCCTTCQEELHMSENKKQTREWRMPHTYVIVFGVVILCWLMTFLVPVGKYDTHDVTYTNADGKERRRPSSLLNPSVISIPWTWTSWSPS